MTPEDILKHEPRMLTQAQRESYFESGYVSSEGVIPEEWLEAVRGASDECLEDSRKETESGSKFDLAPEHTAEHPHVRRIKSPVDVHPVFKKFAVESPFADIAADLVGPNVKFHSCKINYKHPGGGEIVKWHQDIQFFPHTNYNVFTIGCYLADTDMNNGPLAVMPGSHNEPLFDQYDADGNWTGMLSDDDAATLDMDRVDHLTGPAGTQTIHNCRTLHFSPPSKSTAPRPLLLNCFASADAKPYTPHPSPSSHATDLICGEHVRWAHHDPRPCQIPPDWSGGYTSIYAAQAGENAM